MMKARHGPLSSEFRSYPFLTGEEFAEVCHHLERRYCQATLGPVRKRWKLRVCSALNTSFSLGPEYNTYVQIVRPLDGELDDGDLSMFLDSFSFDDHAGPARIDTEADSEMTEPEEIDDEVRTQLPPEDGPVLAVSHNPKAALPRKPRPAVTAGYVKYEIHLHPTYQAPCLWFSLHDLPADEQTFHIDTVFRRLVPDEYKDGLRSAGAIGGISADVRALVL
jgi:ubiquitin-like-conjugating enzyme ATG10